MFQTIFTPFRPHLRSRLRYRRYRRLRGGRRGRGGLRFEVSAPPGHRFLFQLQVLGLALEEGAGWQRQSANFFCMESE